MTATQLLGLPAEILYAIADNFEYASDLNNFTQTCRHVYSVLTPRLEHSFMPAPTPENIHHIIIEGNTLSLARMLSLKSVQDVQMANVLSLGRMASEHCQFKILELLVELYGSAWYIEDVLDHAADWCPVLDEALRQDCSKLLETLNVHLSSRPGDSNRMIRLLNAATSGGLTALVVYLASRARDKNLGTFSFAARFNPPLLTAASSGQLTCLRSLIEGFCISSDTSQSRTPLKIQDQFLLLASRLIYVAAASGHDEVVRYLLQTNAVDVLRENPDIEGLNECFLKSSDVSRELTVDLFHGLPDIETLNGSSLRSFHISNESAVELILAELRDLSFHMSTPEGKAHPRAFLWAIFTNNIIFVQRLLESGHVPQDEPGNTPALALRRGLNLAIRRCHVNICELILAKLTTANAPIGTSQYMEHLSLALATKNASIARVILHAGTDLCCLPLRRIKFQRLLKLCWIAAGN
ncbi:hypothetical protein N7539_000024 [Penicillium diatomitis]|uniref:Uncharacterized protein n=1 Tax=Penicillium diatomitis TaxID=2819901 RepID=A0A9W9XL67_9EURO|nr:uncharacterized protein N7539_000024 [Penicillium diatomitis]KAJ5494908.1 hypothetical protein N7539_000024 [Penicillium diatomitis]